MTGRDKSVRAPEAAAATEQAGNARTGHLARIRLLADAAVRSRLTIPAIVVIFPALIALLYANVLYPTRYDVDSWLYLSWARDFAYHSERWSSTYYFVRFAVTVPGNLIYSLFSDQLAPVIWGFFFNTIFLASVAGVLRRLYGPGYALAGLLFVASDVVMQHRMSYGYTDGPATAYLAASLYFTVRAANETHLAKDFDGGRSWAGRARQFFCGVSFFLAGLTFGLATLTYFSIAMWALPLTAVFLLLAKRDAYRVIGPGVMLVIAGGLAAFLFHVAIFHHFTGQSDFWRPPLDFSRQHNPIYDLALDDFAHGYLHTTAWPHLIAATIVYFLSLGVCLHALRIRAGVQDPSVIGCGLLVTVGTLLLGFQTYNRTVGISSPLFFTYTYLAVDVAAVGFVAYSRRYLGEVASWLTGVLAVSFVLWWLARWLDGTSWSLWSDLHDLTNRNAGLVVLVAGVGSALLLLAAGRKPSVEFSRFAVVCFGVMLLLATGVRADDGWLTLQQGRFDAAEQFRIVTKVSDQLRERYGENRFVFAYAGSDDAEPGSLAWAVNANFLFEYTLVTREWPKVNCQAATLNHDYVFAGNDWVNEQVAIQPILDCGVKAEYVDSTLVQDGNDYLYLSFYRQVSQGALIGSVPSSKLVAINGGKLTGAVLTTDSRQYAYSAVMTLPEFTGAAVVRIPVQVRSGGIGVVITQADNIGEILFEGEALPSTGFIDISLPDGTQGKQVILRNLVTTGASVGTVGVVQVFRPAEASNVPAKGVRFDRPEAVPSAVTRKGEGDFRLRGAETLDLATIAIQHDGTAATRGTFKVRANTEGFAGAVRVVDKDGKTLAMKTLPLVTTPDVVELPVPSLRDAAYVIFSSRDPKARGELRLEGVVAFTGDSQ